MRLHATRPRCANLCAPSLSTSSLSTSSLWAANVGTRTLCTPSVGTPSVGTPSVGTPSLGNPSVGASSQRAPSLCAGFLRAQHRGVDRLGQAEAAMRLAPRFVLAFGFVATLSVAGLGYVVREDRTESETKRFDEEVKRACDRVAEAAGGAGQQDRRARDLH